MILLCGIPSESPLALVRAALERKNLPYVMFNQRNFTNCLISFEIPACLSEVTGWLEVNGMGYRLEDIRGVYTRLMDYQGLPELKDEPADSPLRLQCTALHNTLIHWIEIAAGRVVNRIGPMGSNGSKPYQAQIIRQSGFKTPETLITNDPETVIAFRQKYGRIIYKSISGVRSIVQTFTDQDLERLNRIAWLPTQFQAYVEGVDVRVHVIGTQVFPTLVHSRATDYRYAQSQVGEAAELSAYDLPAEVAERCVALSHRLGLAFSGIDLRITPEQEVYCFEVNPCPGFSYYQVNTGQPIADAVADYLAGLGEDFPARSK
jgi:hypothetical protein